MDEPGFRAEMLEGLVGAGRWASDVIFNAAHQSEKESFCRDNKERCIVKTPGDCEVRLKLNKRNSEKRKH